MAYADATHLSSPSPPPPAAKFAIIADFLELGWGVLLSDVDVLTVQDPFPFLRREHDVEGMSDGFDDRWAYGMIDGFDDPSMGWARYGQIYKRFAMNSGLFYLRRVPSCLMGGLEVLLLDPPSSASQL